MGNQEKKVRKHNITNQPTNQPTNSMEQSP